LIVGHACRGARDWLNLDVICIHFSRELDKLNLRTIFSRAGSDPLFLVRAIGPTAAAHQRCVMAELETFVGSFCGIITRIVGGAFIVFVGKPCLF